MNRTVAIVDDEPDILNLVSINLRKAGFKTVEFEIADELYAFLQKNIPDLIILDLMLPDADGFDVCKYLKNDERFSVIPIIMLTAKGDEADKVIGLEFGADDYVVKPFSPRELVARVKAVLRRGRVTDTTSKSIMIGGILELDLNKFRVIVNGNSVNLTHTEFKLLQLLSARVGWVYSRNQLLDYLWGNDKIVIDRTIDVHIRNLREKLGEAAKFIKNVRGVGYKIEE